MGVEVHVTDSGATGLEARLAALGQALTIGVHEDAGTYPDGTTVATVASAHEFGAGDVPARSFLRGWTSSGGESVVANVGEKQLGEVADGAAPASISEAIGDASVEGITKRMERGISPPLAASTLANPARNPNPTPLLDTHRLIKSIAWEPSP